jgi:predicted amidophosphoribosyltransferase
MKQCPNCQAEVDDNFNVCWNCQYSFNDKKVLENSDFGVICPKCNSEIDSSSNYCPNCQQVLDDFKFYGKDPNSLKKKHLNCLRCKAQLNYSGNFKFHEGTKIGALGDLFELFSNRESFDLYVCPNCGKVEFYLPGFDS